MKAKATKKEVFKLFLNHIAEAGIELLYNSLQQ